MDWLTLILCLMAMAIAVRQIRDNRRRGVPIDWAKTLAAAGGAILVAASGLAVMVGAIALGAPTMGIVLLILVYIVGLTALVVAVNRRWPPPKAP